MAVIRDLFKGADEAKNLNEEAKELLDNLEALATVKAEYFQQLIENRLRGAGVGQDQTVAISKIQSYKNVTKAYVSSDADKISSVVSGAIKGFVKGGSENIQNGVTSLLTEMVTALFGESEGSESLKNEYYLVNEGVALIRLDFMAWSRAVKSTSLTTKVEQVSAFCLYKATVDIEKLDFDTFLDRYQDIITAGHPDMPMDQVIEKCKADFKLFKA
ncbi:hypothetical protein [Lysobacter sp. M2-1]|jgi:hypothetical protein|uniref:hypothetical protein n=1 Tax=Lysobacter sp. M2-1 TaxID=2916839 RepID=UPI001F58CE0C|nr:hypothetical protein [Lysobacter sp. M2-1]